MNQRLRPLLGPLRAALFVLASLTTGQGETYLIPVPKLSFELEDAVVKNAMQSSASSMGDSLVPFLRIEAEGYLVPPNEEGFHLMRDYSLAVRLEEGESVAGVMTVFKNGSAGTEELRFEVTGEASFVIEDEAFVEARQRHYRILDRKQFPGAGWFRMQLNQGREGAEKGLIPSEQADDWERGDQAFAVFSGGLAVAENLSLERTLDLREGKEDELVDLADIAGVTVKPVDWQALLKKNQVPDDLAIDALATSIPEDQAAVFFSSLPAFVGTLDWMKQGVGEMGALRMRASVAQVLDFYENQLGMQGLDRLAKSLPVKSVAMTTSDPYLASGTELSLVFETENPEMVHRALSLALRMRAKSSQAERVEREDWEEWKHVGFENSSREFSAHLLLLGDRVLLTNSGNQVAALAAVKEGSKVSLGALEEYRFFRHRYPLDEAGTGYLFLSDATIRRWVSPQARIGTARRMRAQGLLVALNARKLGGEGEMAEWEKVGSEYLGELSWREKGYESSRYGSARFLRPVMELELEQVTKGEAESYQVWRQGYERGWTVFDPIAFRFAMSEEEMRWELSVLPLTVGSDYRQMMAWLGSVQLEAADYHFNDDLFARIAMALDTKGAGFQEMMGSGAGFLGLEQQALSWIGDSVTVSAYEDLVWDVLGENSYSSDFLSRLPIGVRIESKGTLRLAAFLVALRGLAEESAPDSVQWEKMKEGEEAFVRVSSEDDDLQVFYATRPKALLVALQKETLLKMIAEERVRKEIGSEKGLNFKPQLAATANLRDRVEVFSEVMGNRNFSAMESPAEWLLLPLLNDMRMTLERQGGKGEQVLDSYETIYGRSLEGLYRWNEEGQTMESVAMGYPGKKPEVGKASSSVESWLAKYPKLSSKISFEDDGLQVEFVLNADEGSDSRESSFKIVEEGGEVLGEAKDFLSFEVGEKKFFRRTEHKKVEGEEVSQPSESSVRVLKAEEGEDGVKFELEYKTTRFGEPSSWVQHSQLNGSYFLLDMKAKEWDYLREVPMVELPAELREGMVFRGVDRAMSQPEQGESNTIIRSFEAHLVGLEDVLVPMGAFEDCLRLDVKGQQFTQMGVSDYSSSTWYARGHGVVKQVEKNESSNWATSFEVELVSREVEGEEEKKAEE